MTCTLPIRLIAIAALSLLLAACGSTAPVRHYTLGPVADAPVDAAPGGDVSLVVGPIGLPAGIDRLQMVRLIDGTRAEVADGHRWSGTLKHEIARRLGSEIARRTGFGRVVAWPQASLANPELTLPVDIQRFDAEGFDKVTLEAVWSLRRGGRDIASRRFVASETVRTPDHEGLAAAHGRLVDALARDIVTALPDANPDRKRP